MTFDPTSMVSDPAHTVPPFDLMFRGSGGSDFCSLQKKKKKKWARSCACVRAPNCVVVTQLCSRKKIRVELLMIFMEILMIFMLFFFFFTRHPGHNFRWEIRET